MNNTSIVVYQPDAKHELSFRREDDETYGTQREIAALFNVDQRTVSEHISNFKKEDPETYQTAYRKFRLTAADGKTYNVDHYGLDIITYVGYRTHATAQAVAFRRWVASLVKSAVESTKFLTLSEQLLIQAQINVELERKVTEHDARLNAIEGELNFKPISANEPYLDVLKRHNRRIADAGLDNPDEPLARDDKKWWNK